MRTTTKTHIPQLKQTLDGLRASGHKVKVRHFRWTELKSYGGKWVVSLLMERYKLKGIIGKHYRVHPFGGRVEVTITCPAGVQYHGHADCSMKDNFVSNIGTIKALSRAKAEMERDGHACTC